MEVWFWLFQIIQEEIKNLKIAYAVIEEVQGNKYSNEKNESKTCVKFEEELGLYEILLIDGGVVLACNLCNERLKMNDTIEKHFEDIHNRVLGPYE